MTAGGPAPETDYRGYFRRPDVVDGYLHTCGPGRPSADRLAWEHQRRYLVALLARAFPDLAGRRALDYACGGGRVLRELAVCCTEVHGWDASPEMLSRCRRTVPGAVLSQVDLTENGDPGRGPFDVITVFRLLLNLEPEHRPVVLGRLASLLTEAGLLIVDNHGNRRSLRHLAFLLRRRRPNRFANELADRELRDLLAGAGLQVLHRAGFGWMPEFLHRHRATARLARGVDAYLCTRTRSPWLAIRVMYVAGRDTAAWRARSAEPPGIRTGRGGR